MSRFLKLMGYEAKRIFRNRAIFVMLLAFAIVVIVMLFFVQSANMNYVLAVYSDGMDVADEDGFVIVSDMLHAKVVYVDTEDRGLEMVKMSEATFFVRFERGNGEDDPPKAIIYFDGSNRVASGLAGEFRDMKNKRAYSGLLDWLEEWGVTMDRAYFERVALRPVMEEYNRVQLSFALEIAAFVSLILMMGIAYSLARDRETGVAKNVAYIPIGYNTYFFSKLIPYFILGMLEMLLLCGLGAWLMNITFQINIGVVWLLSSVFVTATLALGLFFSMMRSQISTVFLGMISMLLPLFVEMLVVVSALPTFVRVLLNFLPVTPFIQLFNGMIYNGVLTWWNIPILAAQTVVYYLAALVVIKKQSA